MSEELKKNPGPLLQLPLQIPQTAEERLAKVTTDLTTLLADARRESFTQGYDEGVRDTREAEANSRKDAAKEKEMKVSKCLQDCKELIREAEANHLRKLDNYHKTEIVPNVPFWTTEPTERQLNKIREIARRCGLPFNW